MKYLRYVETIIFCLICLTSCGFLSLSNEKESEKITIVIENNSDKMLNFSIVNKIDYTTNNYTTFNLLYDEQDCLKNGYYLYIYKKLIGYYGSVSPSDSSKRMDKTSYNFVEQKNSSATIFFFVDTTYSSTAQEQYPLVCREVFSLTSARTIVVNSDYSITIY